MDRFFFSNFLFLSLKYESCLVFIPCGCDMMIIIMVNGSFIQPEINGIHMWGHDHYLDPDNLFVATVKMQIYYMDHYIDKNRIIEKHRNEFDEKMRPLTRSIINTQLKSKKECDEYMKKLAVDIIARYALGSPENSQV